MPMFTSGFLSEVAITTYNTIVLCMCVYVLCAHVLCEFMIMRDTDVCICPCTMKSSRQLL